MVPVVLWRVRESKWPVAGLRARHPNRANPVSHAEVLLVKPGETVEQAAAAFWSDFYGRPPPEKDTPNQPSKPPVTSTPRLPLTPQVNPCDPATTTTPTSDTLAPLNNLVLAIHGPAQVRRNREQRQLQLRDADKDPKEDPGKNPLGVSLSPGEISGESARRPGESLRNSGEISGESARRPGESLRNSGEISGESARRPGESLRNSGEISGESPRRPGESLRNSGEISGKSLQPRPADRPAASPSRSRVQQASSARDDFPKHFSPESRTGHVTHPLELPRIRS